MANSAMVNSDGCMYISSGGSANSTTVNSGGRIFVCSGGNAINTTITGTTYTYMTVYSGGSANNISVNTGTLYVDSNAVVQNVTIAESNGNIYIASNAIVQNLTVSAGGAIGGFIFTGNKTFANISNGSVIINNNVNIIGSQMHISSGGIMTDLKTKRYQYALNGSSTREGIPGIWCYLRTGSENFRRVLDE
jgi:autotransporter passenger strand-loop-strand repeat protein